MSDDTAGDRDQGLVFRRLRLEDRVYQLFNNHADLEAAHREEKDIWEDTLRMIVQFTPHDWWARRAAEKALSTKEVDFPRWYS